ncbi:MAG: hypothetical protein KDC98_05830 [Planctomycetes bacterium]|nr:hypothetical protein [Planctomycetota bacterium]
MTALQFSLFFVALLVGYVLVHLRLLRFEEHMRKLAGIRSLDDRLRVLVEAIDKLNLGRIEGKLDRLHDDLEELREATQNVQHAVVSIPRPERVRVRESEPSPPQSPVESPGARVLAIVETRLLQLGYGNIQVLSDVAVVTDHGDADVQVECERGGMPAKGRVQVRNFGVRDVSLQSVAPMFP